MAEQTFNPQIREEHKANQLLLDFGPHIRRLASNKPASSPADGSLRLIDRYQVCPSRLAPKILSATVELKRNRQAQDRVCSG